MGVAGQSTLGGNRSYASGASERPLSGETIGDCLTITARRLPDGLASASATTARRGLDWSLALSPSTFLVLPDSVREARTLRVISRCDWAASARERRHGIRAWEASAPHRGGDPKPARLGRRSA